MSTFRADTSELHALSADLRAAPSHIAPQVNAAVFKGAMKLKADMQSDMAASRSFKGITRSIDFDIIDGNDSVAAEIGPRAEPGSAGNLANIAYFGGSRGGGTVNDPQNRLDEEQPRFEKVLGDILERSLR